jgi:hypothetical protein
VKLKEAVARACQEPTFVKALAFLALWENDRAVKQALEWKRTGVSTAGHGGGWDTCFEHTFNALIDEWSGPIEIPKGCRELLIHYPDGCRAFTVAVTPK